MGKSVLLAAIMLVTAAMTVGAEGESPPPQPSYLELKPSLVANLQSGGKYVRCDVQIMTLNPDMLEGIQAHAPAIRHELLMLLSEQDGARLQSPEGKEALRQQATEIARKVMHEQTGESAIDEIFFTAFFVQ